MTGSSEKELKEIIGQCDGRPDQVFELNSWRDQLSPHLAHHVLLIRIVMRYR